MFVGGSERGVVLSANYPARAYGIAGGMPSSRARRLCPQVEVIHPDFDHYQDVSVGIREIFDTVTDLVEMASIDEAYSTSRRLCAAWTATRWRWGSGSARR